MNRYRYGRGLLIALAVLALSACQRYFLIDYHTDPYGATIESGGQYLGKGHGYKTIAISQHDWDSGVRCINTWPIKAHWVSGAETFIGSERLCASGQSGTHINRLLQRPDEAPGLELDLQYASDLAEQEQEAAAEEAREQERADEKERRHEEHKHEDHKHEDEHRQDKHD